MKIAHVLATGGWGGAERLACALAEQAQRSGHSVVVDAAPLAQKGLSIHAFRGAGSEKRLLAWALAARRRLRAFRPDLVHVHLSTPAFAGAALCATARLPCVFTLHLLPEARWPSDRLTRLPSALVIRVATRLPPGALLVGVSRHDGAELARRFGQRPVRRVLNAPFPSSEQGDLLPLFGDSELRMLAVGRLEKQKGFDRLLTALAGPALATVNFRLVVVGEGPERERLEAQSQRLGLGARVRFAGIFPGPSAMRAAHLLVCPSRYEGMPLVPMEAVLVGCPVVASDIPAHRELFGDVANALLPEGELEWGPFLREILGDATRRLRLEQAQAALAPGFEFERLWLDYMRVYRDLLGASETNGNETNPC